MIIGYRAHLDGMAGTGSGTQTTANAALRVDDQLAGHRVNRQGTDRANRYAASAGGAGQCFDIRAEVRRGDDAGGVKIANDFEGITTI